MIINQLNMRVRVSVRILFTPRFRLSDPAEIDTQLDLFLFEIPLQHVIGHMAEKMAVGIWGRHTDPRWQMTDLLVYYAGCHGVS